MSEGFYKQDALSRQPANRRSGFPSDLYREIFAHSKEAIAILSPEGHYLEQNTSHYNLLGYSDDELQGQTPAIHLGQETFEKVVRELNEAGEYSGEVVSRTKNGEERNLEISAFPMRNDLGEPLLYVGITRDITKRKQAEEEVRRKETQLTDFFENAAIGLHWIGPDGTILRVNQAELDMLGYKREEYLGRNIADFHVDSAIINDILKRLRAGEVLRDYEARMQCKDGSMKYVRINSSVFWEHGKFIHTRCFTRDITDRKWTEQKLALQYALNRILSKSIDFVEGTREILQTVGESLGWQLGVLWATDHQAEAVRCIDVWHSPAIQAADFADVCRNMTFAKGKGLPGRIWASGESAWITDISEDSNFPHAPIAIKEQIHSAFGFPILIGNEVVGVIEFLSKQTRLPDYELLDLIASVGGQIGQFQERARAEEKLAQLLVRERTARADSEKANRLKDEFLATLSHELRTPLNAVIGWSRMLKSNRLDEDSASHALDVIERNAWAQKQIIEDILDVSRVITGKLQLRLGPVNLVSLVNAALDAVRPAFEAKDIEVETKFEDGLRIVPGDADRLQQVVWNLLSNASKFTPSGGKVEIRVVENGAYAQIQVSDTGPGIAPEFLPHVFERFRQADGSTTRTHGGLGLGLAIVRHLVELHGGLIEVENGEGSGATFSVKLPLPTGELRLEALATTSPLESRQLEGVDLEDLRILVVEDERDALDLITMELIGHGANVRGVATATEALALLKEEQFDLLISDIGMLETDGYSLIKEVRMQENEEDRSIPAIALTAYARAQDRMRAIMAGYNTHVAKPVEAGELVTVVKCLTGRLGKS